MKQSEFVKWLESQGVEIVNRKKHLQLRLNGKLSHLPRHPSEELKMGLVQGVKKQLNLK